LIEVCIGHPRGYFNFITEHPQVFEAAYALSKEKLSAHIQTVPDWHGRFLWRTLAALHVNFLMHSPQEIRV